MAATAAAAEDGGSSSVATTRGVLAIVAAFVGLSLGSTMAKSVGSPGAVVAFWRFLVGAVLWHLMIAVQGARVGSQRTVDRRAWRLATVSGVAFGVNLSCFFSGVTRTPIAHAEFISALTPLAVIPLAALTLKERVPRFVVGYGAVALGGITLILSQAPAEGTSYVGDLLVVGAVFSWVFYLMAAKSARNQLATPAFMAVMSTAACATTLPIALVDAGGPSGLVDVTTKGWVLIVVLAITSGMVSHGLIAWAQPHVPVGTISILQLAQPTLGVLWAALFLAEAVESIQLVGMAIVLGAVGTIARRSTRTPVPTVSAPAR